MARAPVLVAAAVLAAAFAPLWTLRKAPVGGDYREQHVPWAAEMDRALGEGRLPWWTDGMLGGFPLLAEGQVGALSPLHLALYGALPWDLAYRLAVLVHLAIALAGMERFLARLGVAATGRAAGLLMFALGTPYAGFFYSVSWRALAWFPWLLWGVERLRARPDARAAGWLALFLGMSWMGGFAQFAFYGSVMTALYGAIRILPDRDVARGRAAAWGIAAAAAGALVAIPQVVATRELVAHSVRAGAGEGFATVGSTFPGALATLLLPAWDVFLQSRLYLGIVPLLALPGALRAPRMTGTLPCAALAGLSLLLALGSYTPVYPLLVAATRLHEMRVPAKFLFFAGFFAIPPLAHGFARLCERPREGVRPAVALGGAYAILLACATVALGPGRGAIERLGNNLVESRIIGRPGHPHPPEHYRRKLSRLLDEASRVASPLHPSTLAGAAALALAGLALGAAARRPWPAARTAAVLLAVAGADLWYRDFHFTGFAGNWGDSADLTRAHPAAGRIQDGRSFPILLNAEGTDRHPTPPNLTMKEDLVDLGGYSPLLLARYDAVHARIGGVNDGQRVRFADPEFLASRHGRALLRVLGARYLVAAGQLPGLGEPTATGDGWALYEDREALPRARFVPREAAQILSAEVILGEMQKIEDPAATLFLEEDSPPAVCTGEGPPLAQTGATIMDGATPEHLVVSVSAPSAGFLFLADSWYPGWRASCDSRPVPILRANAIHRAVPIGPGRHRISFDYAPPWRAWAMPLHGAGWMLVLLAFLVPRPNQFAPGRAGREGAAPGSC